MTIADREKQAQEKKDKRVMARKLVIQQNERAQLEETMKLEADIKRKIHIVEMAKSRSRSREPIQ